MNVTPAIAWLELDAHSKNCVLTHLDDHGTELKWWKFPTQPHKLIDWGLFPTGSTVFSKTGRVR